MTIVLCWLSVNLGFVLGCIYVTLLRERADRADQDAMVEQVMAIVRDENRAMDAANDAARWIPEKLRRRSAAARN